MSKKIGVVGAGLTGSEIALIYALAGFEVQLFDIMPQRLSAAISRLDALMNKGVERGFYTKDAVQPTLARIHPAASLEDLAGATVVIEAVFESIEVKTQVFAEIDRICGPSCLLATNTSTIPISTLAGRLPVSRRGRFIGMHYFSPVSRMKLVEIIPGFDTEEDTVARAMDLARRASKTPIRVKDVAGFAVNRMLHALIIEAVRLVEEGVASPQDLDLACRLGLGHPIGPFALMDTVTSSLCVQAQEIMQEAYGERFRPPALLKQYVRAGRVGGKGRLGWLPKQ
jgi:3-hydroxybutyryl-CoA dehydrogenase